MILLVAFGIRAYNIDYNSPFLDEALYIVLGDKVLSGHWQEEDPFGWVGGMPLLYPPLSALFAKVGGVIGARFFNVLLGTLSVYLLYEFARSLRIAKEEESNAYIGLIAAAMLAVLSVPVFLSRLAIYDMLSFTFFLAGLVLLQQGINLRRPELWQRENRYSAAAVFLFLSFLAKYVTLMFFPFVAMWVLLESRRAGKDAVRHALQYFVAPLVVTSAGYILWQFRAMTHFNLDQIGDQQRNYRLIVTQFLRYGGLPLALATLGSALLALKRRTWLAAGLLIAALSVPVVHLVQNSSAAVNQHTFLSLVFLLPLAAFYIWHLVQSYRVIGVVGVAALAGLMITQSASQMQALQNAWANSTDMMNYVQTVSTNHEKLLSYEDDVTKLMVNNLPEDNITGIYNFQYKDSQSADAYRWALTDGYFDLVLTNEHVEGDVSRAVRESLTNHYAQTYDQHPFTVYKRQYEL